MRHDEEFLPSPVRQRSIQVGGRRTSVSLEDEFWDAFESIAEKRGQRLCDLAAEIESERGDNANLSSAIRLFLLRQARQDRGG